MKRMASLLLALMLALAVPTFAATIEFNGESFEFKPGSEYTATDLFESFKNVMPGDKLTQEITFTNTDKGNDAVILYMKAVAHDEENNPLSDNVAKATTLEEAQKFLSQLTMKVYKIVDGEETLIYEASPDDPAQLAEFVKLATIPSGGSISLRAELEVPTTLGNDFAYALGEVDWAFLVEPYNDPDPWFPPFFPPDDDEDLTVKKVWSGDNTKERPGSVTVTLYNGEKAVDSVILSDANGWTYTWKDLDGEGKWKVLEDNVPKGYTPSYRVKGDTVTITNTGTLIQTGQLNWPIWILGGAGLVLILLGGAMMVRKKKKNA